MADSIYIVSTYYHALIACAKMLAYPRPDTDIAVTAYIPGYDGLAERIKTAGLFRRVYSVGEIEEYKPAGKLDIVLNLHRKNAALIEKQIPFSFRDYRDIYIFHDDIWAAHYCKDKRIDYGIVEDSLDCFRSIGRSPFSYMVNSGLRYRLKSLFRIGYVFYGYEKHVRSIEVNDRSGLCLPADTKARITELPRRELFSRLGESEKQVLSGIFMKDIPDIDYSECTLLLTQPLFSDGILSSEEEQIRQYRSLAGKYAGNSTLVVKPHPRDSLDYSAVFPQAVILPGKMPMEILTVCGDMEFGRAVTFFSTAAASIKAKEMITEKLFKSDN